MGHETVSILKMVDEGRISGREAVRLVKAIKRNQALGHLEGGRSPDTGGDGGRSRTAKRVSPDGGEPADGPRHADLSSVAGVIDKGEIFDRLDRGELSTAQATDLLAKYYSPF